MLGGCGAGKLISHLSDGEGGKKKYEASGRGAKTNYEWENTMINSTVRLPGESVRGLNGGKAVSQRGKAFCNGTPG